MALNQMKSPPGIAVPLKLDVIELNPGSGWAKNGSSLLKPGIRRLAICIRGLNTFPLCLTVFEGFGFWPKALRVDVR
jgi:hypothetical protein